MDNLLKGFGNPFKDIQEAIDKKVQDLREKVVLDVKVELLQIDARWTLSRLVILDPNNAGYYRTAIAALEGL